jgi:hypothetical protein
MSARRASSPRQPVKSDPNGPGPSVNLRCVPGPHRPIAGDSQIAEHVKGSPIRPNFGAALGIQPQTYALREPLPA